MKAPLLRQTELLVSGEEGYHTFRIPTLAVSTKGTLLAVCEGRKYNSIDWGQIEIVLRRSFDNGESWQPMQVIAHDGSNAVGNPAPVVDQKTGTAWLLFTKNNIQIYAMKSTDDGATWSTPEELGVKRDWVRFGAGPCHGIQLKNGRLVIPCWRLDVPGPHSVGYSQIVYSDDHGSTWQMGGTVGPYMSESTIVELSDGTLHFNMRNYTKRRALASSADGGISFSELWFDKALIDPICQASIIRFTDSDTHDRNRILFCNPACQETLFNYFTRYGMTVRLSYDECKTWECAKVLHVGSAAYSDLAIASDMTICCLYERADFPKLLYEKIMFANFNIEWLTDGVDQLRMK